MKKALISVTGQDACGIIAAVSTRLSQLNINILDISQTILGGYFTMLMIVDITNSTLPFVDLQSDLLAQGEKLGMSITLQRTDIFDAMHRI